MRKYFFSVILVASFLLLGCQTWQSMTPEQKVSTCQGALKSFVQPKCQKLVDKGQDYVDLCVEGVDDAIAGCDAIINKNPSVMCDRIVEKADECRFIPDDSENRDLKISACENTIRLIGVACKAALDTVSQN